MNILKKGDVEPEDIFDEFDQLNDDEEDMVLQAVDDFADGYERKIV